MQTGAAFVATSTPISDAISGLLSTWPEDILKDYNEQVSKAGGKLREIRTGNDDLAVVQETQRISAAIFGGQLMATPSAPLHPAADICVHPCARQNPGRPDRRRAAERPQRHQGVGRRPAGHLHNRAARGGTRRATRPLRVDPKTVRRHISQGRLKAVRVGPRLIRIERESLESLGKPVGGAH